MCRVSCHILCTVQTLKGLVEYFFRGSTIVSTLCCSMFPVSLLGWSHNKEFMGFVLFRVQETLQSLAVISYAFLSSNWHFLATYSYVLSFGVSDSETHRTAIKVYFAVFLSTD